MAGLLMYVDMRASSVVFLSNIRWAIIIVGQKENSLKAMQVLLFSSLNRVRRRNWISSWWSGGVFFYIHAVRLLRLKWDISSVLERFNVSCRRLHVSVEVKCYKCSALLFYISSTWCSNEEWDASVRLDHVDFFYTWIVTMCTPLELWNRIGHVCHIRTCERRSV
jgi:hypothetical protein